MLSNILRRFRAVWFRLVLWGSMFAGRGIVGLFSGVREDFVLFFTVGSRAVLDGSVCGVILWLGNSNMSGRSFYYWSSFYYFRGFRVRFISYGSLEDAVGGSEVVGVAGWVGVYAFAEEG